MKNIAIILSLILAACVATPSGRDLKKGEVAVYYISFSVETYTPVKKEDIEQRAHRSGILYVGGRSYNKIMEIISRSKDTKIEFSNIRVKIKMSTGEAIYIAKDGVVQFEGVYKKGYPCQIWVNWIICFPGLHLKCA